MISPYRKERDVDNGETSRQRKVDSSFNARFTDGGILLSSNTISWARKSSIFPLIRCGKLNRQLSSTLLNRPLSLPCSRIIKSDRLSSCVLRFLIHDHQCTLRIMTSVSNIEWYRNTGPPPFNRHAFHPAFIRFITTGNVDFLLASG